MPFRSRNGHTVPGGRRAGFTLLEMLVVLIIVGMTTTLLFQMLSQTFRLQRVAGFQIASAQQGAMQADWLRQVVGGLQPDYQDGKDLFKGTRRKITALSNNPLTVDYGAPVPVVLELAYDADSDITRLTYGSAAEGTPLMSWTRDVGRFLYVDAKGDTHDTWPPPLGIWPQLPQAIRLEYEQDREPRVIFATPRGPYEPVPRVRDIVKVLG